MSTVKTKTVYRDGAIITTERQGGRYIATIRYTQSGDRETVKATFSKKSTFTRGLGTPHHR